jgi:hypothetical protein
MRYYAVSNGVWFVAESPLGPWAALQLRSAGNLQHSSRTISVYHVKHVDVYDSTPDWVYGYTPG